MSSQKEFFIFVGEHSADLHGSFVAKELKKHAPDLHLFGVVGPLLRKEGVSCFIPMEKFQIMGFIEVFFNLPKILYYFYKIRRHILKTNPLGCLFIDYPGFNLRMEASLRKKGYSGKIFHYISPTVWVWKKNRMETLARNVNCLFSILPFEKEFFSSHPLHVEYVGHPLLENLTPERKGPPPFPISHRRLLALFPGSRRREIQKNLPLYLEAFLKLKQTYPTLILGISVVDELLKGEILRILDRFPILQEDFFFVGKEQTHDLIREAEISIAKCGTIALELALFGSSCIITYGLSKWELFLAKKIFHIKYPFYSLPNILLKKEVVVELIGPHFNLDRLLKELQNRLENPIPKEELKSIQKNLIGVLGDQKPSQKIAKRILSLI